MINRIIFISLIFSVSANILSQNINDSLIVFSDIKYHSNFEKVAVNNFLTNRTDTFNLFLAIDKDITSENSGIYFKIYQSVYREFEHEKVNSKELDKKIKLVYKIVNDKFLKRYNLIDFLPTTFQSASYNCVSASILYSMIFDRLKIPYNIMVTSNHVYLIANPGNKEIVIETSIPGIAKATYKQDYTNQFSKFSEKSVRISEDEYSIRSVEGGYGSDSINEKKVDFFNLQGFQYYNMALKEMMKDNLAEAYHLLQKAYFFYPAEQVKIFLHSTLLILIENSSFEKVSEIDYLGHLSRFDDENKVYIPTIFKNIVTYFFHKKHKAEYCDSLYNRLLPQIVDKKIKDEITCTYYEQFIIFSPNSALVEPYAYAILKNKPDNRPALESFENSIEKKYKQITDKQQLLDSIQLLRQKHDIESVKYIFNEYEMIANLALAFDFYKKKKPETGETYLQSFEQACTLPIKNRELQIKIVDAYRIKAEYYGETNKTKEKEALIKGLDYVPNSTLLKSLMEGKGYTR